MWASVLALHVGCGPSAPRLAHDASSVDHAGIHWSGGKHEEGASSEPLASLAQPQLSAEEIALADALPSDTAPTPAKLGILVDQERLQEIELKKSTPQRIHAPARTRTDQTRAVDYASLPIATTTQPAGFSQGASFSLVSIDRTPAVCPAGMFPRQKTTWFMPRFSSVPTVIRVGSTMLPRIDVLDGTHEEYLLDELVQRSARATWTSMDRASDSAEITEWRGDFRRDTKRGEASVKSTVEATALVKGTLYAFRKCNAGCGEPLGSRLRDEELVVLGPPAFWVGSSDDPETQTVAYAQPFSVVSARLNPGGSASVTLLSLKQDVEAFRDRLPRKAPTLLTTGDEWISYTLDVVWPHAIDGDEASNDLSAPEVNLFTGAGVGNARQVAGADIVYAPPPTSSGCSPASIDYVDPIF